MTHPSRPVHPGPPTPSPRSGVTELELLFALCVSISVAFFAGAATVSVWQRDRLRAPDPATHRYADPAHHAATTVAPTKDTNR